MVVKKIKVLQSDIKQSVLYSGNIMIAHGSIETWLHMKALEIWHEKGAMGTEPEFRDGFHPCPPLNGQNCLEIWGVFPDDAIAKATFEAAIAEKVLLRTSGDFTLTAEGVEPIEIAGGAPDQATLPDHSRLNLGMGCIRKSSSKNLDLEDDADKTGLLSHLEEHPEIHVEQARDGKWTFRHDDNETGPDAEYFRHGLFSTREEAIRAAFDEYGVEIEEMSAARIERLVQRSAG